MTAQLANGGYKIYPRITVDKNQTSAEDIKHQMKTNGEEAKVQNLLSNGADFFNLGDRRHIPLYQKKENIRYVLEAMFSSTNEILGTSYRSRIDNPKYQFAGKTGTSQVKKITERDRELELKLSQIPYEERDHALYVAFGPYKNPRYAVSIIVEHGGAGSAAAAPIAKKLFKLIIDRHELREEARKKNTILT
tara:strand:- start:947 stop:1522 length:576 start_codon:yes stop_codon:yes gene_type:complete